MGDLVIYNLLLNLKNAILKRVNTKLNFSHELYFNIILINLLKRKKNNKKNCS